MKFCRNCVTPDTRPGIQFDMDGVCLPCNVAKAGKSVDWEARRKEIEEIADWGRKHCKMGYDCIVAVSGGKDSTRQALLARDELGLRPLLVCCQSPSGQLTDLGRRNLTNLADLGFDLITIAPAPHVWKEVMKRAFYKFGNLAKTELALYAIPPRVAIGHDIPLVFLGENNVLTYGDVSGAMGGDANQMKHYNTLSGGDPAEFVGNGLDRKDLIWYTYPTDEEMESASLRVVYLGYYFQDFNNRKNAEIAIANGLEVRDDPREDIGALSMFDALDDFFIPVNQMLKHFKFGVGKATDEASEAIRLGIMSREEAVELVKKYDGKCATRYIEAFCAFIGISVEEFWLVANSFRNPDIWEQAKADRWQMRHVVS